MLQLMRSFSQHILFKTFLMLIIISFVIFGIGDIFKNYNNNVVEIDGNVNITISEFIQIKRNEIHKLQQLLGAPLTTEQLQSFNIDQIILNRLINDKLLELETKNLNIRISDDTAANHIKSKSMFHDISGKFDKDKFKEILINNNIKERHYIDLVKQDIASKFLINTIKTQPISLTAIAKYANKYKNEERVVDIISFVPNDINISSATDEELLKYYNENKAQFYSPEYRKFSYLIINLETIARNYTFSNGEIKAEYENNINYYQKPETRNIVNYVFDTKEKAEEAYKSLQFDSANKSSLLKNVTKEQLPKELKDIAFSLHEGKVSQVIHSPFGFHIIKIQTIFPTQTLTLEEAKKSPSNSLLHLLSEKKLVLLRKTIEDEIAAGNTLQEIASNINLSHEIKVSELLDSNGNNFNKSSNSLPTIYSKEILKYVFNAQEKEDNLYMLPDNSGFLLLKIEEILPSHVKPFENIKEEVNNKWYKSTQQKEATAITQNFVTKLQENINNLNDLLTSTPIAKLNNIHIKRNTKDKWPESLIHELFNSKANILTSIHTDNEGNKLIGMVRTIITHKEETLDKELINELKEQLKTALLEDYLNYLHHKYTPKINYSLLKNNDNSNE
ncbi:MAG: SurA N-terminal domain-containing protein [Rickettsiales endosymbiont of Dermacentor nuttalli]